MGFGLAHILVVEDNPADVYLLRKALVTAKVDFELTVIDDGAEALEFIRNYGNSVETPKPDLVVLDLNLTSNGGIEVLEALRRHYGLCDVPVAVVTSSSAAVERAQAEELRVERFITKPPDLEAFLQIGMVLKEMLAERSK